MPGMPIYCGCPAGTAPRPIRVRVTGKPVRSASSVSSCEAAGPELITPPPAYKIGFLAVAISLGGFLESPKSRP